jgi:hypothetical protein
MIPNTLKVGIGGAQAIGPTEAMVDAMPHCLGLHCAYFLRTHPPEGMESTIISRIGEPDQDVGETETVQSLGVNKNRTDTWRSEWEGGPDSQKQEAAASCSRPGFGRSRHRKVDRYRRDCGMGSSASRNALAALYIEPILAHPSQFGHSTQLTDLPQSEATDSHGYGPDLGCPYP